MKVSGQLHAPAALTPVPNGQEAGWAPEPVWMRRESNSGRPAQSSPACYSFTPNIKLSAGQVLKVISSG
jgi:hypothetical protein